MYQVVKNYFHCIYNYKKLLIFYISLNSHLVFSGEFMSSKENCYAMEKLIGSEI